MASAMKLPESWTVALDEEATVERSFTEALRDKYCTGDVEGCRNNLVLGLVIRGKPRDPSKGQAELGFLRNVILCDSNITHAGIPKLGLQSLCPNVVDLDLSNNLIDSWKEVLTLWAELPHLKYVNLTRNSLKDEEGILGDKTLKLPAIDNLVLNQTNVRWRDVALLCDRLPSLQELHICGNGYREIPTKEIEYFSNIQCLRLNKNVFTSWDEIWKLKKLPKLCSLILSENPVAEVFYDGRTRSTCNVCLCCPAVRTRMSQTDHEHSKDRMSNVEQDCRLQSGTNHAMQTETTGNAAPQSEPAHQNCAELKTQGEQERLVNNVSVSDSEHTEEGATDHVLNKGRSVWIPEPRTAPIQPNPVRFVGDKTAVSQNMINEIMENVCPRRSSAPSLSFPESLARAPSSEDVNSEGAGTNIDFSVIAKQPAKQTNMGIQVLDKSSQCSMTQLDQKSYARDIGVSTHKYVSTQTIDQTETQRRAWEYNCQPDSSALGTEAASQTDDGNCRDVLDPVQGTSRNLTGQAEKGLQTEHSIKNTQDSKCTCAKIIPFASLETLCLSKTDLSSVQHLEELSKFPKLRSLKVKDTKVFADLETEERRRLVVACLPNVRVLNGGEVTTTEREKGERYFIRYFQNKPTRPSRYEQLEEKHGRPEDLMAVNLSQGFCEWADMNIVYNSTMVHTTTIHVVSPVGKLRTYIAEQVLHVPRKSFKMYHYACGPYHLEGEEIAFNELILDSLPMSRYDFMHGDEIHIEMIRV